MVTINATSSFYNIYWFHQYDLYPLIDPFSWYIHPSRIATSFYDFLYYLIGIKRNSHRFSHMILVK